MLAWRHGIDTCSKFKATCLAVVQRVKRTGRPVLITRFGEPIAEVVPPTRRASGAAWLGSMQGSVEVFGDELAQRCLPRAGTLTTWSVRRLLLDTHIWRWSLAAPEKLGRRLRAALARRGTELWLSPVSVWELLVLAERGRIKLAPEPRQWIAIALGHTPPFGSAAHLPGRDPQPRGPPRTRGPRRPVSRRDRAGLRPHSRNGGRSPDSRTALRDPAQPLVSQRDQHTSCRESLPGRGPPPTQPPLPATSPAAGHPAPPDRTDTADAAPTPARTSPAPPRRAPPPPLTPRRSAPRPAPAAPRSPPAPAPPHRTPNPPRPGPHHLPRRPLPALAARARRTIRHASTAIGDHAEHHIPAAPDSERLALLPAIRSPIAARPRALPRGREALGSCPNQSGGVGSRSIQRPFTHARVQAWAWRARTT